MLSICHDVLIVAHSITEHGTWAATHLITREIQRIREEKTSPAASPYWVGDGAPQGFFPINVAVR